MNLHLIIITVYSAVIVVAGLFASRLVRSTGDFFVAGRSLGPGLVFATVLAANIGAGSTVGAASLGYRFGLSAWWWVGSAALGTFGLAFWVGPKIRRIAAKGGFFTVGDFLESRYGVGVRGTVTLLVWLATPAILAGQLIALSVVLDVVAGVPRTTGILLGAVVTTVYFTAGGLRGSAWINLMQVVVLVIGFALAVPLALRGISGFDGLRTLEAGGGEGYLNFFSNGQGTGWTLIALLAPAFIVSPGLLQKVYGARDDNAVRWGVGLSGLALLLFAFAPVILGMVARYHNPGLLDPDQALPFILKEHLPVLVGAIALGAFFVADLSSADAILFMLATSFSQDLYRRFLAPDASERTVLLVARSAAVLGGALAVGIAVVSPSVVSPLRIFYSLMSVSLFVPVVAGLYAGRVGAPEAFAAVGAGVSVTLVSRLTLGAGGFGVLTPNMLGLTASALAFGLIWFLVRHKSRLKTGDAGDN